jgi:hypothetical protein
MNTNLEIKALRRLVDEQRSAMEEYREGLRKCIESIDEIKVTSKYSLQDKDKALEGYKRELERLQHLDRIRAVIDPKSLDTALMKPLSGGNKFPASIKNNSFLNRNVTFNM